MDSIVREEGFKLLYSWEARVLLWAKIIDGRFGRELWLADGSEAGTFMVSDLIAGERGSSVDSLVELDGDAYFVQSGGGNEPRLWRLSWLD